MKIPSKSSETVHQKLRRQRDNMAGRIESLTEQIKEARAISKRHLEAGREELHAKKELLIEQLTEKRRLIIITRRQLARQLETLSRKDVVQNQRRRRDIKEDFFFASKDEYWERMPRSLFKTFQEMHCARRYWTVPKREGDWGGVDAHQLPLAHTVVDPSRVSPDFLEHFDIPEKSLLNGKMDDVQAHLTAQDSVDSVKAFYQDHVQPLPDFGYESKNPNFRILAVKDHSPEHDGEIIHPRRKSRSSLLKEPAIFRDAYSLRRKTEHMGKGYSAERTALFRALNIVKELHAKLGAIRADDAPREKAEKREEAERSLGQKPVLSRVRDNDKAEARETLETIDLTDSRGQVNPPAAMAKLVKVRDRLSTRGKSVRRITDITDKDKEQLKEVIRYCEDSLLHLAEAFKSFHDGGSFAHRNEEGGLVPAIRLDLGLKQLRLRPFRFYAAKLEDIDAAMYRLSREGKTDEQRRESLKGHAVCQVFKVQKAFEDCLAEVSLKNGFTQEQLVAKARTLYRAAKHNSVEGYETAFDHLMEIVDVIGQHLKDNPYNYDGETLRLTFKEYLKSVDFQAVVAEAV
ncbi:hypothetical protein JW752_04675 [Candidatus Peregrinibacteria bacterium]|nr:hypothetical protein [Candidatus Peregrinibacteria bacterium]